MDHSIKLLAELFFFTIFTGICMEAMCSTRSSEPIESVITCLQALYTLLDSDCPREILMGDRSLGIELCNVLHRLGYNSYCHVIVINNTFLFCLIMLTKSNFFLCFQQVDINKRQSLCSTYGNGSA